MYIHILHFEVHNYLSGNEQSSCSSEMSLLHKGTRYGIKTVGGKPIVNHVCMTYHGNQYSMHILIADLVVSTG